MGKDFSLAMGWFTADTFFWRDSHQINFKTSHSSWRPPLSLVRNLYLFVSYRLDSKRMGRRNKQQQQQQHIKKKIPNRNNGPWWHLKRIGNPTYRMITLSLNRLARSCDSLLSCRFTHTIRLTEEFWGGEIEVTTQVPKCHDRISCYLYKARVYFIFFQIYSIPLKLKPTAGATRCTVWNKALVYQMK